MAVKQLRSALVLAAMNATTHGQEPGTVNDINGALLMTNAGQVTGAERALRRALSGAR